MTRSRLLSMSLVALVFGSALGDIVSAQDLPVAPRGTVKVRSRVFNPFAVEQSRITLNPFGMFTVTDGTSIPAPTSPSPVATSAAPPTAASSGLVVDTASNSNDISSPSPIVVFAVRPPFRPPTRSPWRPPPRPPFLPP